MLPIQKRCTLPPHEEANLPSWSPLPWPSPLPSLLPSPTPTPLLLPSLLPLQLPITVAAAVNHYYSCRGPSPPPSLLHHLQPLLSLLPLPLDISISVIVGHCSCHRRRPSPSPCRWPFPRVVALARQELYSANRSKECLPKFYFVGTVGGVLIKTGSLTRCRAAMANTSVGQQAASSERLVRELTGSWGAAGSAGWRQ